jgi:hypothetical protein
MMPSMWGSKSTYGCITRLEVSALRLKEFSIRRAIPQWSRDLARQGDYDSGATAASMRQGVDPAAGTGCEVGADSSEPRHEEILPCLNVDTIDASLPRRSDGRRHDSMLADPD